MRVLELGKFYPPHRGGMETLLRSFCEGFVKQGMEVECHVASEAAVTTRETINGVGVNRFASLGTVLSTSVSPGYLRSLRRERADLWHHHFPNPLADATCWLGNRRTPLVITYHSDVVRQSRALFLYVPLLRWLLNRATCIVGTSPATLEYSPWLAPVRHKCEVIPAGINQARFKDGEGSSESVAGLRAAAKGRLIVLTVGRLVGYKGHRFLIDAIKGLEVELWIVGTGPLETELRARAAAQGLGDRVRFYGEVPDEQLPAMFHACDIFALASISPNEAFGLVQVEAMASGKPVVSCALASGVPFVNLDGVTGLIVPPADAGALNGALRRLAGDPGLRERLGQAGRERAAREFEEAVMVKRYGQLFERLAGNRKVP